MKSISVFALLLIGGLSTAVAQNFHPTVNLFSHGKTTIIKLVDGTEVKGTIKDLKRKKFLIKSVKLDVDGKTAKYDVNEIAHMYASPKALTQLSNAVDMMFDAQRWDNLLDSAYMMDGYVYLERVPLTFKRGGKEQQLLLQLVNPFSSAGVRVFADPKAGETMGAGIGGITLVGGAEKSYYIQKADEAALRLKKKNYKEEFAFYFGDCDAVASSDKVGRWSAVQDHVNTYAAECGSGGE